MATREQIMSALLALVESAGPFVTSSRRAIEPNLITPSLSPACFLFQETETTEVQAPGLPRKRYMNVLACLYNDVGTDENLIPETAINNALDALDAAMGVFDQRFGRFTLGGLVYSAARDGETKMQSGALTGKCAAFVPIKICIP